jgi:ribosomal protein S15P/S13E
MVELVNSNMLPGFQGFSRFDGSPTRKTSSKKGSGAASLQKTSPFHRSGFEKGNGPAQFLRLLTASLKVSYHLTKHRKDH